MPRLSSPLQAGRRPFKYLSQAETLQAIAQHLPRRVKVSLILMLVLANVVWWVQAKLSPPTSAAPLAAQAAPHWPQIGLDPPATLIAPLVSAKPAANIIATPISILAPLATPSLKPTPFFLIHTVQAGESLISIAARYNLTTEKLLAANEIRDPTNLVEGRKLLIPSKDQLYQGKIMPYDIREGDTLLSIASKYGSSVTAIEVANPHLEFDPLSPGETIAVPVIFSKANSVTSVQEPAQAIYHVVQSGETPLAIAAAYDLPVEILLTANHIGDPTRLQIGQKLMIPPHPGINHDFPVILYELIAGDTLVGIASRFGSSVKAILAVNLELDPASLEAGQLVAIPVIFAPARPTRPPSAVRPTPGPPPLLSPPNLE